MLVSCGRLVSTQTSPTFALSSTSLHLCEALPVPLTFLNRSLSQVHDLSFRQFRILPIPYHFIPSMLWKWHCLGPGYSSEAVPKRFKLVLLLLVVPTKVSPEAIMTIETVAICWIEINEWPVVDGGYVRKEITSTMKGWAYTCRLLGLIINLSILTFTHSLQSDGLYSCWPPLNDQTMYRDARIWWT